MYDLSPTALDELRRLIKHSPSPPPSTVTEFPPLYTPALSILLNTIQSMWSTVTRSKKCKAQYTSFTGQGRSHEAPLQVIRGALRSWIRKVRYVVTKPGGVLASGIVVPSPPVDVESEVRPSPRRRTSTRTWISADRYPAARRYRPLVILIHLSTSGRNVLKTLFTGLLEVVLLVVLTCFFAAQWGANLMITLYAMLILVAFITLGRMLGLIYVSLSAKVWGLHVINCDEDDEVRGVLRIICSMMDVLVLVNGATYCDGYRVDQLPAFAGWQRRYENGELDEPDSAIKHDQNTQSSMALNPNMGGGSSVAKDARSHSSTTELMSGESIELTKYDYQGDQSYQQKLATGANSGQATPSASEVNQRPVFTRVLTSGTESSQGTRQIDDIV